MPLLKGRNDFIFHFLLDSYRAKCLILDVQSQRQICGVISVLDGHKKKGIALLLGLTLSGATAVFAIDEYSDAVDPMLETQPVEEESAKTLKVTAVYGVNADDYLPVKEDARRQLRPKLRENSSTVSFDLPDAFYFIGGPIFLLIFLRVLVIFINGFEETRRHEMRMAANEHLPGERFISK